MIQTLTRTLKLFFLRCYKDYDISSTIAVLRVIQSICVLDMIHRCLIEVGGPSVVSLFSEVITILVQILRCMNTAQDNVKITPGQGGKKGGKKNRRRVPAMQLAQGEEVRSVERFAWNNHPQVTNLYVSVVKVREMGDHDE